AHVADDALPYRFAGEHHLAGGRARPVHGFADLRAAGADQAGQPDDLAGPYRERHVAERARGGEPLDPQHLLAGRLGRPGREDVLDVPAGHERDDLGGGGVAGGQADRDGAAVLQYGDAVADLADLLQPVGDVDHGDALGGHLADDAEEVGDLVVGERGRRLV